MTADTASDALFPAPAVAQRRGRAPRELARRTRTDPVTAELERLEAIVQFASDTPDDIARSLPDLQEFVHRARAILDQVRDEAAVARREGELLRNRVASELNRAQGMRDEAEKAAEHARMMEQRARAEISRASAMMEQAHQVMVDARVSARVEAARRSESAIPDIDGEALRPDPRGAATAMELIDALRRFRLWAGKPSFREMAARSGFQAGASTMCELLGGEVLPDRIAVIDAVVRGCGGTDEDRQRFAAAWRALVMQDTGEKAG